MLTSCLEDPFKQVVLSLRKIKNSYPLVQHNKLNVVIQDLHSICIFNDLLIRLLDFDHYRQLCQIYQILALEIDPKYQQNLTISKEMYLQQHFVKSHEDQNENGYQKVLRKDMTPSTKKSRAIATPNIVILVQDLLESIEKFEYIQGNLEHLLQIISNFHRKQQIFTQNDQYQHYDGDFKRLFDLVEKTLASKNNNFSFSKNVEILQIHKHIKQLTEFMNDVVNFSNQIEQVMKMDSPYSQNTQQNQQALSLNQNFAKQSNDANSKRSLLTQMLRDSSQKSNFQIQNQFATREIIIRPATKQYSQKENLQMMIDPSYRISVVKSQKPRFNSQKLIKSQMEYAIQGMQYKKRKAEIHAKANGIGCSKCQIF